MHVFTYGTLMFPEVWQTVVGRESASLLAHAPGFRIFRVMDAVYPGIVAAGSTDVVAGILYLAVDDESFARLDRFESDFYQRRPILITTDDGRQLDAEAYIIPDQHRHLLTDETWTAEDFQSRGDLARFVARYAGFDRLGLPPTDGT